MVPVRRGGFSFDTCNGRRRQKRKELLWISVVSLTSEFNYGKITRFAAFVCLSSTSKLITILLTRYQRYDIDYVHHINDGALFSRSVRVGESRPVDIWIGTFVIGTRLSTRSTTHYCIGKPNGRLVDYQMITVIVTFGSLAQSTQIYRYKTSGKWANDN
jgi:hypothetical protein